MSEQKKALPSNVESVSIDKKSKLSNAKAYEIELDDNTKYHIKIGVSKYQQLKIQLREGSKFQSEYETRFKYEELLEIDRFFGVFETMEQIVDEMDNLFVRKQVSITRDINNNVFLNLTITINNRPRVIHLKLIKKGTEQLEALNNLVKLVSAQTRKLDNLQNENDKLKTEIGKLHNKIEEMDEGEEEEDDEEDEEGENKKSKKSKKNKKRKNKKSKKKKEEEEEESESEDEDDSGKKKKKKKDEVIGEIDYKELIENSNIIKERKEIDVVIDKIRIMYSNSNKDFLNMKLLYSASKDGDSAEIFHSLCDGLAPIVALIKTTKGIKFGGYTEVPFEFSKKRKGNKDDNAFIFSINKEKCYDVEKGTNATCSYRNYGPVFYGYEYCNIYLYGDFFSDEGNVAKKGDRYNTTEDFEINDGEQKFMVKELEVYQVYFKTIN